MSLLFVALTRLQTSAARSWGAAGAGTANIANIAQSRHPRKNIIDINNIIICYCTVKTIQMLQLRPFKCYS